jgi:hypothetical protein
MGIAGQQDIPQKKAAEEPWTFKRLFPFGGATTSLAQVFIRPFDILLGYLILIIGFVELLGRHVSWMFWAFTILILCASILERHFVEKDAIVLREDFDSLRREVGEIKDKHLASVENNIKGLSGSVHDLALNVTRLTTIIDERIPKTSR